jgi:phosphoribosylglycinamide formyltransferase-1
MAMEKLRLGAFISGGGTNLQSIIDNCQKPEYPARIVVVMSNQEGAYGLKRAEQAGIPTVCVPHKGFKKREEHEREIVERIEPYQVEAVALAGYMRVVTAYLLDAFYNRRKGLPGVINIHPADTRAYQGAHGYEFAMGMLAEHPQRLAETKITVHFVDAGVDTGPIIQQASVPVLPDDGIDDLRERGLKVEHRVYPEVIRLYAEGKLKIEGQQVIIL